jgi:biopolymer transport protein TolQ
LEVLLLIPFSALALFAQGAQPEAGSGQLDRSTDIVRLVADATVVGQIVLLILLVFSAVSWAVIFYKIWAFRKSEQQSATFLSVFRKSSKFSEVQAVCPTLTASPLVGIFQSGYAELNTQLRTDKSAESGKPAGPAVRPTLKSLDAVDRALLRATTVELNKLEHRVPFLATTASITPFIGLFGTVWGIVIAFQGIATAGNTSLGVVAQPIAEALIATAAGLFAAIPAVYFYNHFTNKVKKFASEMDDFSLEFLNIAERNFT